MEHIWHILATVTLDEEKREAVNTITVSYPVGGERYHDHAMGMKMVNLWGVSEQTS